MPRGGKRAGAGRKPNLYGDAAETVAAFTRSILEDPVYQETLRQRAYKGKLSPPVEQMLWAYAYGKPVEPKQADRDDLAFMQQLLTMIGQHVVSRDGKREIQALIEAHAGTTGLRAVA